MDLFGCFLNSNLIMISAVNDNVSKKNDLLYKDYIYDFETEMYYLNSRY